MTVATGQWFWSTPQWAAYCDAYGGGLTSNIGPNGNLVVMLDDRMWSRVKKGHQAAIRKAERELIVVEDFASYRLIHQIANGNVRPGKTFDFMESWLPENGLVLSTLGVAAFFIIHEGGSYYASGPRTDYAPDGAAHLLIWIAMTRLRERGIRWLDMGPLPDDDPKHQSIAAFKRHFGAVEMRWPYD